MHKKTKREQFISLVFENVKTKLNFNYRPLKSQTRELFLCILKELITKLRMMNFIHYQTRYQTVRKIFSNYLFEKLQINV